MECIALFVLKCVPVRGAREHFYSAISDLFLPSPFVSSASFSSAYFFLCSLIFCLLRRDKRKVSRPRARQSPESKIVRNCWKPIPLIIMKTDRKIAQSWHDDKHSFVELQKLFYIALTDVHNRSKQRITSLLS